LPTVYNPAVSSWHRWDSSLSRMRLISGH
jgi:hypothetical protein